MASAPGREGRCCIASQVTSSAGALRGSPFWVTACARKGAGVRCYHAFCGTVQPSLMRLGVAGAELESQVPVFIPITARQQLRCKGLGIGIFDPRDE